MSSRVREDLHRLKGASEATENLQASGESRTGARSISEGGARRVTESGGTGTGAKREGLTPAAAAESGAVPAQRNRALQIAGIAGIALLAIGAAYGVYSLVHRAGPMPFQNFSITQVTKSGKAISAAISPDGKYIFSVVSDKGQRSLWLRHLPTDSDTQIVPPSDAYYWGPIFAPDGNYVYFLKRESAAADESDLYRAPILGGTRSSPCTKRIIPSRFRPTATASRTSAPAIQMRSSSACSPRNADGSDEKLLVAGPIAEEPFRPRLDAGWKSDRRSDLSGAGEQLSRIEMFDAASVREEHYACRLQADFAASALVWMPDGNGMLLTAESRGTGFIRDQIDCIEKDEAKIRLLTQDTNSYKTHRLSARMGKILSAVQRSVSNYGFFMSSLLRARRSGCTPGAAASDVTRGGGDSGARRLRIQLGAGRKAAVRELTAENFCASRRTGR